MSEKSELIASAARVAAETLRDAMTPTEIVPPRLNGQVSRALTELFQRRLDPKCLPLPAGADAIFTKLDHHLQYDVERLWRVYEVDEEGNKTYIAPPVRIPPAFAIDRNETVAVLDLLAELVAAEPPRDVNQPSRDRQNDIIATPCTALAEIAAATPEAGTGAPAVVLRSRREGPIVRGKQKPPLTRAQYNVVKALLDAGDDGLAKDDLDRQSGHAEARKVLQRLAEDPDWKAVIHFPGKTGRGYRIG